MTPANLRRLSAAALVFTFVLSVPTYAQKRRSVAHRVRPVSVSGTVTGTVLDAVTNAPVIGLTVTIGNRSGGTDAQGKFEVRNATGEGSLILKAERSGYVPATITIGPNDPKDITIRLTPTPTVTLRRTNGQTVQIDTESIKFGYSVPFTGVIEADFEDFCTADGTKVTYSNAQMKRLVGPPTKISGSPCCSSGNATRMNVTLRTGESADLVFVDSCEDRNQVEVGGRNHVTGVFERVYLTEVAEIVFP
jgi:hypothetical protein